jgi:hypothetical protein
LLSLGSTSAVANVVAGIVITSPHYRAMRDGNEPAMAPVIAHPEADPA